MPFATIALVVFLFGLFVVGILILVELTQDHYARKFYGEDDHDDWKGPY